jgi:tricorn protease
MIRNALLVAAALLIPAASQAQVKLLRHPTYFKGKVAFSYLGDIWTANENGSGVQRLTDNKARDVFPRYSPDGTQIAFSSNRDGNYDVFVIPAAGGKPKQLTYHTADDNVVGWSADGKRVLFSSSRAKGAFPTVVTLFEIPVDGGVEESVPTDWGASASYSADGKKLAFMRHPSVWSRKHYRGSYAGDLWVMDVAAKTFARISGQDGYQGNWLWPVYGDGYIYFVSDRTANEKNIKFGGPEAMKSANNIWKVPEKGGAAVQVTKHETGNLYFPSISADRKTIVYEENFGLWKLDLASGKSSEIVIDIKSDTKENDTELVTLTEAEGFHISPSNRRAAIVSHGEVFTVATDRGEPQRVSESPWREQDPRWSPNGKWIAFVSDRTGRQELWISDELGKNPKKLSDADCDKSSIVWSPDSKSLMWSGSDHKLRRVEIESGKEDAVAATDTGAISGPQFSPDGKWISYAKQDKLLRSHVWVKELATGQEKMITSDQFQISTGAKWTADGKKLLVIGGVNLPSMASQGFRGSPSQLFAISLSRIDKNPDDRDINTEEQAQAALSEGAGRGGRGPGAGGAAAAVEVKIEWDGIDRRVKKLTSGTTSVFSVYPSPDSRTYAFMSGGGFGGGAAEEAGGPGLYIMADDGSRVTRLNTTVADAGRGGGGRGRGGLGGGGGSEPQWSRDGRNIYMLIGGGIYSVSVPATPAGESATAAGSAAGGRGGRGATPTATPAAPAAGTSAAAGPRRIPFTVRMVIDRPAERRQVFEEAWRVMKNRFYDEKMHGVNWASAKDRYESLLPNIADTDQLHDTIMTMIGELNASHTGVSGGGNLPGQPPPAERIQTRYPGFELTADASGFYKVSRIYRKGPADYEYVKLSNGNFILAVDGKPLTTKDNYWQLFNILGGQKFEFLVNSKPATDGAWTVDLQPLAATQQGDLEYTLWVEGRKNMVDALTSGAIGYLHIRAMDAPSLLKFQEDLIDNRGKKALIIDQRFNGGGGIDQELLQILNQRKQYQLTRGRDATVDVPRPVHTFYGPMAVLQNERSASDAEMFPDGFRALGLGKVIGTPTMGAVIGTGSYSLIDGSTVRTPGVGVYLSDAARTNMENYGVQPDIFVENTPEDNLAGRDRELDTAVQELIKQLDQKPGGSKPTNTSAQQR